MKPDWRLHVESVPTTDERVPEGQRPRPRLGDYLTEAQQNQLAHIEVAAFRRVFDPFDRRLVPLILDDWAAFTRLRRLVFIVDLSQGSQRSAAIAEIVPIITELIRGWQQSGLLVDDQASAATPLSPMNRRSARAAHARRLAAEKRESER